MFAYAPIETTGLKAWYMANYTLGPSVKPKKASQINVVERKVALQLAFNLYEIKPRLLSTDQGIIFL